VAPTWEGMVALQGLLEPEAGQLVVAALEPLARPANGADARSGDQRRADALVELARRNLEGGQLPQTGGIRPQLTVTVDLDSLLGHPGAVGGELGGIGPLEPEACRRLACDSAVTRVLVTRHQRGHQGDPGDPSGYHGHDPGSPNRPRGEHRHPPDAAAGIQVGPPAADRSEPAGPLGWLRAAVACSPRPWAAPPANPSMSAGPAGSSPRPSAAPWPCATAAGCSPTAPGPLPGARATT
jgi:Domain of unknown function (DUF222)